MILSGFCILTMLARGPMVARYTWFGWKKAYNPDTQQLGSHTDSDSTPAAGHVEEGLVQVRLGQKTTGEGSEMEGMRMKADVERGDG